MSAVAVYCGASPGAQKAYQIAARSVGIALAEADRRLVYGGGSKGIMGVVSGAVLEHGGRVTGVIPFAILAAGGEGQASDPVYLHTNGEAGVESGYLRTNGEAGVESGYLRTNGEAGLEFGYLRTNGEAGIESMETIVVNSMHERKVEMAQRSCGFVGLPGGFGTFEEVLEVTTWTQLGLHAKPVILANVLSFFDPLRQLIQNSVRDGFVRPENASLITFVDGPADPKDHKSFDWGKAVLDALDGWDESCISPLSFDWANNTKANGLSAGKGGLAAS